MVSIISSLAGTDQISDLGALATAAALEMQFFHIRNDCINSTEWDTGASHGEIYNDI